MNALSKHSLKAFNGANYKAKDTTKRPYETKKQIVFQAFTGLEKTMLEVEKLTGVKRTTICGYVGQFRKKGLITDLYKAPCRITDNKAKFFKTV